MLPSLIDEGTRHCISIRGTGNREQKREGTLRKGSSLYQFGRSGSSETRHKKAPEIHSDNRYVKPEYKVLKEKMNAYNKTNAKLYGNMFGKLLVVDFKIFGNFFILAAEDLNKDGGYVSAYWKQDLVSLM
ncbi:peptidyl-prolyl cis-trans isomerase FKBP62-like protein, partial [Tanacetum coccineum]